MDDKIRMLLKEQPNKGLQMAMKQYGGLCWSIARNQLQDVGTREDVEDCVSDAFAALYEAREKLDGQKGTVKSYLAVIAKRKAIDCYHRLIKIQANEEKEPAEVHTGLSEAEFQRIADRAALFEAIKALGEPDTQIILRRYFLGQSTKEIAAALQLKENTVDKKVQRGLAKLRIILEGGKLA